MVDTPKRGLRFLLLITQTIWNRICFWRRRLKEQQQRRLCQMRLLL